MPKATDRHGAPKIEMCEVLVDAIREALKAGALRDFYRLISPALAQVGVDAPETLDDTGATIGEALIRVACEEQARFAARMEIVREYQRERWARWNAKNATNKESGVNPALANARLTVGQAHTDTDTASVADTASDTDTASVPKRARAREGGDADFERFWSAYGKRGVRKTALAAFRRAEKSPTWPGVDAVCEMVAALRQSQGWTKDGGQYQPHAATWLNQERWADGLPPDVAAAHSDEEVVPKVTLFGIH